MARAIDADALQELCNRRIQDTWNSRAAPVSWAAAYADFKDDIDSMPTLTTPNEWVSVKERLPEESDGMVLFTNGKAVTSGYRNHMFSRMKFVDRFGAIEDILGDDYDLDRLRELVEADRDGRCVVLPVRGYTDKDGEQALNSAMNTCFYHNNPVTRYIADAVAEKLTREAAEAALNGERIPNH